MKRLVSLLVAMAMLLGVMGGVALAETPDWALDFSIVDAGEMPSPVKRILYLEGSWYEMGYQYAQQAPELVMRAILYAGGNALMATYGGPEGLAADETFQTKLANVTAAFPELVDAWHGMADAMGIPFAWIAMSEARISAKVACSHLAAWGDATVDGSMYCGSNYDMAAGATLYLPTIIARPRGGNAFISATGFSSVATMNDKGVVTMASRGQNAVEGDTRPELLGGGGSGPVIASKAATAQEAKDLYIGGLAPGNAENFHCIDPTIAYMVEHTCNKDSVRMGVANEEGYEVYGNQYSVSANGFLTQDMQASMETFWLDNLPRYWTEERYVVENYGKVDINTINDALSSTKVYIPHNWEQWITENNITWFVGDERETALGSVYDWDGQTGWIDFDWNPAGVGLWSPENRTINYGATSRMLAEPAKLNCYLMVGMRNTVNAKNPNATGTYAKLHLGESTDAINAGAGLWAEYLIFYASSQVDRAGAKDTSRDEYLNMAKQYRMEGFNYTAMAKAAIDADQARDMYSRATTSYCKAQCYAQMALDDPTQIITDGNTSYFMG